MLSEHCSLVSIGAPLYNKVLIIITNGYVRLKHPFLKLKRNLPDLHGIRHTHIKSCFFPKLNSAFEEICEISKNCTFLNLIISTLCNVGRITSFVRCGHECKKVEKYHLRRRWVCTLTQFIRNAQVSISIAFVYFRFLKLTYTMC